MGEIHEIGVMPRFGQTPDIGGFGLGALDLPGERLDGLVLLRLDSPRLQLGANDAEIVHHRISPDQIDVRSDRRVSRIRRDKLSG